MKELLNTISIFPSFSGLKPNLLKCEVEEVKVVACGIKCIDLTKDAKKIIKKNIELKQNFKKKNQLVLKKFRECSDEEISLQKVKLFQNTGFIKIWVFS